MEYLSAMVTDADDFSEDLFETIQEILEARQMAERERRQMMESWQMALERDMFVFWRSWSL